MTIANWIAIFVPLLTLIGGAIVYNIQKAVDRKNQLRAERRELYRKFVALFSEVHSYIGRNKPLEDVVDRFVTLKSVEAEILVCAPDHVVEGLKALTKEMAAYAASINKDKEIQAERRVSVKSAYDEAVSAMRRDVLGESMISVRDIAEFSAAFANGFTISIGRTIP